MSNCKKDYLNIFVAWNENVSSSDIYHLILYWINDYIHTIKDVNVVSDATKILERMGSDDSSMDIVEDFINHKYNRLHNAVMKMD